jgi:transcriptional regulator with XRE-family HTH domain
MPLTIGQTIKNLRKERNFTQEELAEQLNVTAKAISKWENETGLPDISQIVPLASVFGVSTDVLFGTVGTSDDEEIKKIINDAYYSFDVNSKESLRRRYDIMQDGLKHYPNAMGLLVNCLQTGIALSYPENGPDCYDEIHGEEIYQECIRMANLIISYGKGATDILQAHMGMVFLHSAYGNIEKAWEHAEKFPERPDFTRHNMCGYIAYAEKNYANAAHFWKTDFHYNLTALFDDMVLLGKSYRFMGKYDDALKMFFDTFSFMEILYKGEKIIPPIPNTDSGDAYVEIARTYLEMNDKTKALDWLEKMVDYDANVLPHFKSKNGWRIDIKQRVLKKLDVTEFDSIKNNERFIFLMNRANALDD